MRAIQTQTETKPKKKKKNKKKKKKIARRCDLNARTNTAIYFFVSASMYSMVMVIRARINGMEWYLC